MEHIPHTDDKYGPFVPSTRPRGDRGGRRTASELNQAEAEIIPLDGVQVARSLNFIRSLCLHPTQGPPGEGGGGGASQGLVFLNHITLQDLSDRDLSRCVNTARIDGPL